LRAAGVTHLHVTPVGPDVPGLLARVTDLLNR
jgi:hypothetical protein